MDAKTYVQNVLKTEANNFIAIQERFHNTGNIRLVHAMVGMCTETGEIQDQLKKHLLYGKTLDKTNLVEELGDLMWYIGIMSDELGVSLEEIMEKNIAKLKKRYGDKFTEEAALNRDIDAERAILDAKEAVDTIQYERAPTLATLNLMDSLIRDYEQKNKK